MATRFEDEARREVSQNTAFKQWFASRIEVIHRTVSAADILARNGVRLRYGGQRGEQIFCPFHGNSRTMAAKYHPSDARSHDHVWCFVCNEQWDAITLWKKYANYEGKFAGLLRSIEREYGITAPEAPEEVAEDLREEERIEILEFFEICERRLKAARHAYDMRGYLAVGVLLDRLGHAFEKGTDPPAKVRETLKLILDKVGTRARTCPDG